MRCAMRTRTCKLKATPHLWLAADLLNTREAMGIFGLRARLSEGIFGGTTRSFSYISQVGCVLRLVVAQQQCSRESRLPQRNKGDAASANAGQTCEACCSGKRQEACEVLRQRGWRQHRATRLSAPRCHNSSLYACTVSDLA